MRITFESSHTSGDFSRGLLTVGIGIEDDAARQTTWDEIEFSVPPDFHAHNDAVAAALMTLAGRRYNEVAFNFPISTFGAETLRAYYGDIAIGPVDPAAAPRGPGSRIGLNFSGGLDSTAGWLLLREVYGDEFAVITSEYGNAYAFEALGYASYHRDVSCWTDLRRKQYNREGRFNFCVPLLFADYLDLWGVATGHILPHSPDGVVDYRGGERPAFLSGDLVVNAGGLEEVHLLRSLSGVGVAKVLLALGPERIEAALAGSAPPGSIKPFLAAWILRFLHEDAGLPVPAYLREYPSRRRPIPLNAQVQRMFFLYKRAGREAVAECFSEIDRVDLSFLDDLSLRFLERYNPILVSILPAPLRDRIPAIFQSCGIAPYNERDWDELAFVRRFLVANFERFRHLDA